MRLEKNLSKKVLFLKVETKPHTLSAEINFLILLPAPSLFSPSSQLYLDLTN
jgi:hypothetical protein